MSTTLELAQRRIAKHSGCRCLCDDCELARGYIAQNAALVEARKVLADWKFAGTCGPVQETLAKLDAAIGDKATAPVCERCGGPAMVYAGYDFSDGGKYLKKPCDCRPEVPKLWRKLWKTGPPTFISMENAAKILKTGSRHWQWTLQSSVDDGVTWKEEK